MSLKRFRIFSTSFRDGNSNPYCPTDLHSLVHLLPRRRSPTGTNARVGAGVRFLFVGLDNRLCKPGVEKCLPQRIVSPRPRAGRAEESGDSRVARGRARVGRGRYGAVWRGNAPWATVARGPNVATVGDGRVPVGAWPARASCAVVARLRCRHGPSLCSGQGSSGFFLSTLLTPLCV